MPLKMAARIQVEGPLAGWKQYAKLAREFGWERRLGNSLVVREPVGAINPWNFPLDQITLNVAPAFATGCTVVLEPSEVAPINAFLFSRRSRKPGCCRASSTASAGTGGRRRRAPPRTSIQTRAA